MELRSLLLYDRIVRVSYCGVAFEGGRSEVFFFFFLCV